MWNKIAKSASGLDDFDLFVHKLKFGITLGLCFGLLNIVPYLQIVGTIPCLLLAGLKALEQGDSFIGALGLVLLIFGFVQLIE